MSTYDYPFDETGLKPTNRVSGEQHILTVVNELQYSKVVPRWAPFYADGFVARIRLPNGTLRTLVEGEDFYFGHYFASASRATGKNIYGSINLLDRSLQGAVILDQYQIVGGKWSQSPEKILEILVNHIYNPRLVYWEDIADVPEIFPSVDHEWNITDMVGMSDVTAKLSEIVSALLLTSDSGLVEHTANLNNPHGTNKAHVGLSLVENYPVATEHEAREARSNVVYMTGLRVRQAIEEIAVKMIEWHMNEEGNVHNLDISTLGAVNETQLTNALLGKLGVNQTARDSNQFNGMSYTQLANSILLGTASNSMRLAGFSYEDLVAEVTSQPSDSAARLEGHTLQQVLEAASQQVAADAEKLNGQTLEEFSPLVPIIANHLGRFSVTSSGTAYPLVTEPYYAKVGESCIPSDSVDDNFDVAMRTLQVTIDQITSDGNVKGTGVFSITLTGRKAGMYRVVDLDGVKHFRMEIHHEDLFTDDLGETWIKVSLHALIDDPLHHIAIATTANGLVFSNFDIGVMTKPVDMGWLEDVYEFPIPPIEEYPDAQIDGTETLFIEKDDKSYQLPLQSLIDRLPEGPDAFETWKRNVGRPEATFVEYRDDITGNDAFIAWKAYTSQPSATFNDYLAAIKGDKGDKGDTGEKGDKGEKGDQGVPGNPVDLEQVSQEALRTKIGTGTMAYRNLIISETEPDPVDFNDGDIWIKPETP